MFNKLKKALSMILVIAMLCSLAVVPAAAAVSSISFKFEDGQWTESGGVKYYDVNLTATSNSGEDFAMYSGTVNIAFDNTVLNVSAVRANLIPPYTQDDGWGGTEEVKMPNPSTTALPVANANGRMTIVWAQTTGNNHTVVNGQTIAILRFKVADASVEKCSTVLSLTSENIIGYYDTVNKNYALDTSATCTVAVDGVLPTINTVKLDNDAVTVLGGGNPLQYVQASAASVKGTDITAGVLWTVSPEIPGVSVNASGKVEIAPDAVAGTYTISANAKSGASQGAAKSATLTVSRVTSAPTGVVVEGGQASILIPADGAAAAQTAPFTVRVLDQFGDEMSGVSVDWSIDPAVPGVSVSNGVVTVTNDAKTAITTEQDVVVKASCGGEQGWLHLIIKRDTAKLVSFEISGADTMAVPTIGDITTKIYTTANGVDQYGNPIDIGTVTWRHETTTGVANNQGKLTAAHVCTAGTVTLIATAANGVSATKVINVTKDAPVGTSIKVFKGASQLTGTDTIIIPTSDAPNTYTYTAKLYDQYGEEMAETVTLTFATADAKVTFANGTVTVAKGATKDKTYTLTASYGSVAPVKIIITAKDIDITAPAVNTKTATYGMKWSQIVSFSGGKAELNGTAVPGNFYLKNADAIPASGTQTYEIWFKSTNNAYDLKAVDGTVTVAKKPITVTMQNASKVYGEVLDPAAFSFNVPTNQLVNGDDASVVTVITASTGAAATAEVGTAPITGTGTADNYAVTVAPATLTVTARPLAVNAGDLIISKVYDGTTAAGIRESGALGLTNVVNGDDVSVSYTNIGAYADANAGSGKAVMISGLSLSGAKAGNYTISATSQEIATGKITPAQLTAAMLTFTPATAVYDGSAKTVTVSLKAPYTGAGALTAKYNGAASAVDADTYAVTVSAAAGTNFEAAADLALGDFVINPKNISAVAVEGIAPNGYEYTGSAIEPAVTVTDGSKTLTAADYTIAYTDNVNYGTGKITITGKGNYTGTKDAFFTITKKQPVKGTDYTVTLTDSVYDGTAKTAAVEKLNAAIGDITVKYNGSTAAPVAAGTYTVTADVAASENYSAMTAVEIGTMTISPKQLSAVTVADIAPLTYTGSAQTPAVTVTDGTKALVAGTDYTAAYTDNTNAGTAAVTLTGKGNYAGTAAKTFVINKAALTVTAADQTVGYGSELNTNSVIVNYAGFVGGETAAVLGGALAFDSTYTVDSSVGGEYAVTPKGLTSNNYVITFVGGKITVTPKDFSDADITAVIEEVCIYNGTEQTPAIVAKNVAKTLAADTDYTVAYTNNTNAGTATATLTGKGNYTGTKAITFPIQQKEIGLVWSGDGQLPYDGTAKNVTAAATGLAAGDEVTVTVKGGTQTNVGEYEAIATGLAGDKAANYKLPANVTTAYSIATVIDEVTAVSAGGTLTAVVDGMTIKLSGFVAADTAVTLTAAKNGSSVAITSGSSIAADKLAAEDNKVEVGGVTYNLSAADVVVLPANVTLEAIPTVTDIPAEMTDVAAAFGVQAPTASNLCASAAKALLSAIADKTPEGATAMTAKVGLHVTAVSYDAAGNLVMNIVPQVAYFKDDATNPANKLGETETIPNNWLTAPVAITAKIPGTFVPSHAKLYLSENGTQFTMAALDSWNAADRIAAWNQTGFGKVELLNDTRAAEDVKFQLDSGSTATVSFAAEDIGSQLPADERPGYRFMGWIFSVNGTPVNENLYTTMSDELLTALAGQSNITAQPQFARVGGGGGGGSASTISYIIRATAGEGGSISPTGAVDVERGDSQTFTFKPLAGYQVKEVLVDGKTVSATDSYTFKNVTAGHTISVTFEKVETEDKVNPFTDVKESDYYYNAVLWAVENAITAGMTETTFAPGTTCTRGQMVTFLWRAAGKPEPRTTANPFTDISESAYYYKAVLWAVESGITNGVTDTTFAPNATCTRGQMATFLWRAEGKPVVNAYNTFADVKEGAYYYDAVLWAAENGITTGKTSSTFAPNDSCTRGQIVTFLYRKEQAE